MVVAETDNVQGPDMFTPDLYLHLTGDTPAAIETEKRALSLVPEGADESTRKELETNLRTFEAALAETDRPPADGGDR